MGYPLNGPKIVIEERNSAPFSNKATHSLTVIHNLPTNIFSLGIGRSFSLTKHIVPLELDHV